MSSDDRTGGDRDRSRKSDRAVFWGLYRPVDPSVRREVMGSLFFTGDRLRPYLVRFSVLLALSVIIASYGILSDSTAVVIGGMLVAPLMTPILGMAAASVMAWPRRLGETTLLVAIASAGAIALAWLVASFMPEGVFTLVLPGELTSRTEPTVLDLGIAIAAGAAGAYVLVHKDAVSALPGVAVAVALVPPLAVVGISLALGNYHDAGGAMILFLTNLAGIVLAAMVVFLLTGFVPEVQMRRGRKQIWLGFTAAGLLVLLVSIPLLGNSYVVIDEARSDSAVRAEVERWLGDEPSLDVEHLVVSGNEITLNVVGPEPPPIVDDLRAALEDDLGGDVSVKVVWIEATTQLAGSPAE